MLLSYMLIIFKAISNYNYKELGKWMINMASILFERLSGEKSVEQNVWMVLRRANPFSPLISTRRQSRLISYSKRHRERRERGSGGSIQAQ